MQRLLHALLGFRPSQVAALLCLIGQLLLATALAIAFAETLYPCAALRVAVALEGLAALVAFLPLMVEAGRKMGEE